MDTIGKKLGLKEKMAYGCGDAASNIIWASTGTFLMFYYTDVVNINAATIGVIFLIARVINAVVALLTGWLIDNTHSKYGKARPWLLWFGSSLNRNICNFCSSGCSKAVSDYLCIYCI